MFFILAIPVVFILLFIYLPIHLIKKKKEGRVIDYLNHTELSNSNEYDLKATLEHFREEYDKAVKSAEWDHSVSGVWRRYTIPSELDFKNRDEIVKVIKGLDLDGRIAEECTTSSLGPKKLFKYFDEIAALEPSDRLNYQPKEDHSKLEEFLRERHFESADYDESEKRSGRSDNSVNRSKNDDAKVLGNMRNLSDSEIYNLANDPNASASVREAAQNENNWRTMNKWID